MPSESKLVLRQSKKLSAKPRPKQKPKRESKQKQRLAQEKLNWPNSERPKKPLGGQQQSVLAKLNRPAPQKPLGALPQREQQPSKQNSEPQRNGLLKRPLDAQHSKDLLSKQLSVLPLNEQQPRGRLKKGPLNSEQRNKRHNVRQHSELPSRQLSERRKNALSRSPKPVLRNNAGQLRLHLAPRQRLRQRCKEGSQAHGLADS